jgi:hypothetical protein
LEVRETRIGVRGTALAVCSRVLTAGRDFLCFKKIDCTQQSLITTMTRGALVITPTLLAVVPTDADALRFVKALLEDAAVDAEKLDNALTSMLRGSHTRWVFPIAELESFNVTTGFFGMITLKMPRESLRRIVIRDKGGKAAAKAFFDAHGLVRDADRGGETDRAISR